jgi:hypothetical protein
LVAAPVLRREWKSRQAGTGHREPLPRLAYCSPLQTRPCILSFNLEADGELAINLRTENLSPPDFNIKIRRGESENFYVCRRTSRFSLSVICTGEAMPVGEALQFLMLSKKDNGLLAEGTFPIIGLALATPELASTPTFIPSWDRPPR